MLMSMIISMMMLMVIMIGVGDNGGEKMILAF